MPGGAGAGAEAAAIPEVADGRTPHEGLVGDVGGEREVGEARPQHPRVALVRRAQQHRRRAEALVQPAAGMHELEAGEHLPQQLHTPTRPSLRRRRRGGHGTVRGGRPWLQCMACMHIAPIPRMLGKLDSGRL